MDWTQYYLSYNTETGQLEMMTLDDIYDYIADNYDVEEFYDAIEDIYGNEFTLPIIGAVPVRDAFEAFCSNADLHYYVEDMADNYARDACWDLEHTVAGNSEEFYGRVFYALEDEDIEQYEELINNDKNVTEFYRQLCEKYDIDYNFDSGDENGE